jgi:hypothetical protein
MIACRRTTDTGILALNDWPGGRGLVWRGWRGG